MKGALLAAACLWVAASALQAADETDPTKAFDEQVKKMQKTMDEHSKQFQKDTEKMLERFKTTSSQRGGQSRTELKLDNKTVLSTTGKQVECKVEGEGAKRALVVRVDGQEKSRVALPDLNIKAADLPPLAFPNVDAASVKTESRSVNGVSTAKVWVNGKVVYEGPGGNPQTTTRSENGKKFVEVKVDGRVVYHAGEGDGAVERELF